MNSSARISTRDLCMIGLWTAVIAVMSQFSIPMPMGVPMTMQTFAISLAAIVLGARKSTLATGIYVLLGAIGIPVFANFSGGLSYVVGPTGGFILSFPIMAFIIGLGSEYGIKNKGVFIGALVMGTVINYIVGVLMFCIITKSPIQTGIMACVLPFIPTAIIKAVLASVLGLQMRRRLVKIA